MLAQEIRKAKHAQVIQNVTGIVKIVYLMHAQLIQLNHYARLITNATGH